MSVTASGAAITWNGTDVYSRSVQMEYRATASGAAVVSGDYLLITVTVTMPHGHQVSVQDPVERASQPVTGFPPRLHATELERAASAGEPGGREVLVCDRVAPLA